MATDKLTGNMPTENVLMYLNKNKIATGIDEQAFAEATRIAGLTFPI
jgi:hypothetical protein